MGSYDAIGKVSEALVDTLRTNIVDREGVISLDRSEIVLTSPDDIGTESDTRLSLYLFKVEQSDQRQPQPITDNDIRKGSPLALNLHYLLTAYPSSAGQDGTRNSRDQHSVLGLAMQVLHDTSSLSGETLGKSFSDDQRIDINMKEDAENTVSRIWDSFRDVPLYPSVTYEVSPVLIDSRREEKIQRVAERQTDVNRKERSKDEPPRRP